MFGAMLEALELTSFVGAHAATSSATVLARNMCARRNARVLAEPHIRARALQSGHGRMARRLAVAMLGCAWAVRRKHPERVQALVQDGKVALVTGGDAGIGKATVAALARSGEYRLIILAGHNEQKHNAAIAEIEAQQPSAKLQYLPLELSSLDSVKTCAKAFQDLNVPLHTLICNAAVMALPERKVTPDGYEYQLEVNYLSHFLLINLLYPQLVAAGKPNDPARVVSVSSSAHFVKSPLGFGDVSDLNLSGGEKDDHAYYPWTAYGQSKLAQVMFTYELAKRLEKRSAPVVANVLDPGFVDTELQRYLPGQAPAPVMKLLAKTPERGAETSVFLATADAGRENGVYWADSKPALSLGRGASPFPMNKELAVEGTTSYNEATQAALWNRRLQVVLPNRTRTKRWKGVGVRRHAV